MKLIRLALLAIPFVLVTACSGDPLAPAMDDGIGTLGSGSQVAPSTAPAFDDGIGTLGSGS